MEKVIQLKPKDELSEIWIASTGNRLDDAACWRNAILTTSTTIAKKPKPKVMTRIVFCRLGRRILVKIGIGRKRIARSVMMFTGEEER